MPQLSDSTFHQTVSLICRHDKNGAVGVVLNRVTAHRLGDIFSQLALPVSNLSRVDSPVFDGGPVSPELGMVVHSGDSGRSGWQSSLKIGERLWMTGSRDILGAIAQGEGPEDALMILGYSGWGPGQLELEMGQNSWFYTPAAHSVIFHPAIEQKWQLATQLLGIDATQFSDEVGHA